MLNDIERAQAASYGWVVCEVWDLQTQRLRVQVLPTDKNDLKSADALMKVVMHRAQNNDAFAQRVLKLVMDSMKPPTKKRKKP